MSRNNNRQEKKVTAENLGKISESKRENVQTFMRNKDYLIQRAAEREKKNSI